MNQQKKLFHTLLNLMINNSKVAVLLDTQGPEIRTGDRELPMNLKLGDMVSLTVRDEIDVEASSIKINYKDLIKSVKKVQEYQLIMD